VRSLEGVVTRQNTPEASLFNTAQVDPTAHLDPYDLIQVECRLFSLFPFLLPFIRPYHSSERIGMARSAEPVGNRAEGREVNRRHPCESKGHDGHANSDRLDCYAAALYWDNTALTKPVLTQRRSQP
jgi:hypothetical protein